MLKDMGMSPIISWLRLVNDFQPTVWEVLKTASLKDNSKDLWNKMES